MMFIITEKVHKRLQVIEQYKETFLIYAKQQSLRYFPIL